TDIQLSVFCDASLDPQLISGGIAVTFCPWLPGTHCQTLIELAWNVSHMFDSNMGEALALSQCLQVVIIEISRCRYTPAIAGKTIKVRIFNDSLSLLSYLKGTHSISENFKTLAGPVLDIINDQTRIIKLLGVPVDLQLHWIPGHQHS
ncbi:hypothetical protein B0H66DRAFT_630464, partial [Apodospora peruviana]